MENKSNEQTETNTCSWFDQAINTGLDTTYQSDTNGTQEDSQNQDKEDN